MRSAVTISLVEQARGGPFVYWHDLPGNIAKAAKLGFDAVELFAPGAEAVNVAQVKKLLSDHGLKMAAVGTGAGWVIQRLSLTSNDDSVRRKAIAFIKQIIEMGGALEAPAIIGSMQGRWGEGVEKDVAFERLGSALVELGAHAKQFGVPLIYEPLNRYETNMCNTVEAGVELLKRSGAANVTLLADLFHMNIEEADLAAAIRAGRGHIGHVHLADSNRRPAGCGHTDFRPVIKALREIGYAGYLSAECFSWPDADGAAQRTIEAYRKLVG
jgi:sugar phosphate isomerase/epimerase